MHMVPHGQALVLGCRHSSATSWDMQCKLKRSMRGAGHSAGSPFAEPSGFTMSNHRTILIMGKWTDTSSAAVVSPWALKTCTRMGLR